MWNPEIIHIDVLDFPSESVEF